MYLIDDIGRNIDIVLGPNSEAVQQISSDRNFVNISLDYCGL